MTFVAKYFPELSLAQLYEILKARSQIFMLEQNIHCQDMDDVDYISRHYFLEDGERVAAYLRAFYEDEHKQTVHIGRVLSVAHGKGLGAEVMRRAITDIRETMEGKTITLDAQKYAQGFYEKMGFHAVSDEFLEEGIPHIKMQFNL